ncbi:MAG: S-layer homology domain-containing protein [Cyanobacteria bacterium J06639_14]
MTRTILGIGVALLGLGAIAPLALGNEQHPQPTSMEQLDLPAVEVPVRSSPAIEAPKTAEFVTDLPATDVSPSHWAYTAVENLVEVYGCLEGYPDGTFRGDEFVTRYEFAAAMDACLNNFFQLVEQERQVDLGKFFEELAVS